uniref:Prepilin-type N-terminal cleavage/methylation domain-containing protein n=1 Tax=Fervidobacterium thailandense TaxID=1008305 RepID=A0A7C4RVV7_9BACT
MSGFSLTEDLASLLIVAIVFTIVGSGLAWYYKV